MEGLWFYFQVMECPDYLMVGLLLVLARVKRLVLVGEAAVGVVVSLLADRCDV